MGFLKMAENGSYGGYICGKKMFLAFMLLITAAAFAAEISAGSSDMPLTEVLNALFGRDGGRNSIIIYHIRLPRAMTAVVAGAGLAAAGCVLQSILGNPLASSSTLGVSQGAAFGAAFAIIVLGTGINMQSGAAITITNPYITSVCAFIFSMVPAAVVLALTRVKGGGAQTIILSGVALSTMFQGGTALIEYFAADTQVAAVVFWTFGSLSSATWREIGIMAAVTAAAFLYFFHNRWNYNAILGGEAVAKSLGVNTVALTVKSMAVCSLTVAVIVSYVGIINFIGLIAPHMMRKAVGNDYRYLLPASALMGSCLLLFGDMVSRLAAKPAVLPIGAITSFLGAPLFLYLICRGGRLK